MRIFAADVASQNTTDNHPVVSKTLSQARKAETVSIKQIKNIMKVDTGRATHLLQQQNNDTSCYVDLLFHRKDGEHTKIAYLHNTTEQHDCNGIEPLQWHDGSNTVCHTKLLLLMCATGVAFFLRCG